MERYMPEGQGLEDDKSLTESEILDSLNMIELLAFIQENFGVVISKAGLFTSSFSLPFSIV
jgi:acyl carrier protein